MRYTVLEDGKPIDDLAILPDLATAKHHGEKLAAKRSDTEVCIDGYPEKAGPMPTWRFDREANEWVETTTL